MNVKRLCLLCVVLGLCFGIGMIFAGCDALHLSDSTAPDTAPPNSSSGTGGGGTTPTGTGFCSGTEIFCIESFTTQIVQQLGGTEHGDGIIANGTYSPGTTGGLMFPVTIDTNRGYVVELEIEGNIPIDPKAVLFRLESPNISYFLCLERLDRGPFTGVFRLGMGDINYHDFGYLLTAAGHSGAYTTIGWGNEPHILKAIARQSWFQLIIDNSYVSGPGTWIRSVPGNVALNLMIGNHVQYHLENTPAWTRFKNFKIYYE